VALHHVQSVTRPATLEEAWGEKEKWGKAARFLGGGIDVVLYTPPSVESLIDLTGLGLSGVTQDVAGITIGATTTMTEAIESSEIRAYAHAFLIDVLKEVASPLQRNVATFGGTLGSAHPWSDVIPALLVLDATLILYDGAERTAGLEQFLADRARGRGTGPIICGIRIPRALESSRGAHAAFTRTAFDVATLNVSCVAPAGKSRWSDLRIAVGGTPGLATRLRDVESAAVREAMSEEGIADAAASAVNARDDARASGEYRRTVARALVARCLRRISEEPEGNVG